MNDRFFFPFLSLFLLASFITTLLRSPNFLYYWGLFVDLIEKIFKISLVALPLAFLIVLLFLVIHSQKEKKLALESKKQAKEQALKQILLEKQEKRKKEEQERQFKEELKALNLRKKLKRQEKSSQDVSKDALKGFFH